MPNNNRKKHPKIDGGYVVIPDATIKCNQFHKLKPPTRLLYIAMLIDFIRDNKLNPDNLLKISHNQMELYSGLSHGSVVRGVRELKDKGFVRVETPGGLELGRTTFQVNGRYLQTGSLDAYW